MQVGNEVWETYMMALKAAQAEGEGRKPRGADQVGAFPTQGESNQLPQKWSGLVEKASHVIYHYGTPVAWYDGSAHEWVVPAEKYSVQTSGVQDRIRGVLGAYRTTI